MKEQDEMKKNVEELKKIAEAPATRRKSLLTPKEWSVVSGILFAALAGLLTLSLDLIAVPENDYTLWILMAGRVGAFFFINICLVGVFFWQLFLITTPSFCWFFSLL